VGEQNKDDDVKKIPAGTSNKEKKCIHNGFSSEAKQKKKESKV
jgi:hypothetical protein